MFPSKLSPNSSFRTANWGHPGPYQKLLNRAVNQMNARVCQKLDEAAKPIFKRSGAPDFTSQFINYKEGFGVALRGIDIAFRTLYLKMKETYSEAMPGFILPAPQNEKLKFTGLFMETLAIPASQGQFLTIEQKCRFIILELITIKRKHFEGILEKAFKNPSKRESWLVR